MDDMKTVDIVAMGSCYLDINTVNFPLDQKGIPADVELVGGDYDLVPGGSAVNFCRLLQRLGQQTAFIGMAGDDRFGQVLETMLRQQGVRPALVKRPELRTNVSFNITGIKEHILLAAGTANAALSPEFVLPKIQSILGEANMLYLGGCFKLRAFAAAFADVTEMAKKQAAKLAVDHGRIPPATDDNMLEIVRSLALQSDYYLPSREEFLQLWNAATIEEGLRLLQQRAPQLTVVVKDGQNGAWFLDGQKLQQIKAETIEKPSNLTGAGDSFNAGLIAALRKDRQLAEAIGYAHRVAAAHITGRDVSALKL